MPDGLVSDPSAAALGAVPDLATLRVTTSVASVASFDELYASERARLVAVLWALTGSRAVAEDLAHDAFVRAFVHWDHVSGYERPDQWLRRVAINLASNRWRRMRTEHRTVQRLAQAPATQVDGVPEVDEGVWQVVRALPARQAQALVLSAVDGYSSAEIAAVLGCREGTVRTHLHRAREAAQRRLGQLDPHGIEPGAASDAHARADHVPGPGRVDGAVPSGPNGQGAGDGAARGAPPDAEVGHGPR
jgi:RNA polymerase sigma-70 factor, ECF subfamily